MNRVWFITGAARGMGGHIAKAALQQGDSVVATGRNMDKLRQIFSGGEY
ncbi:SDR family NAD(P)-dependent oxidoreductase [Klebsiella sp. B345]